jgi:signal transduction histidine kinase/phage shock protein PspC (stress-responsive transcriptional regulator)
MHFRVFPGGFGDSLREHQATMQKVESHLQISVRPVRSSENRLLFGVVAGVGERLGIDPILVRAAFVALSFALGFGVLAYFALWLLSVEPQDHDSSPAEPLSGPRQVMAVGSITLGLLIALREIGWWLGDGVVWPGALSTFGVAVIWAQGEGGRVTRAARLGEGSVFSGPALLRVALGALLVFTGMAYVVAQNMTFTIRTLFDLFLPVIVTVAGVTLVFGPWLFRLGQQVADERRRRIRSQERSEVAAHLHDSVLQTLALIQRSRTPREMTTLARVQERELRSWLYGSERTLSSDSLESAIDAAAARVEQAYQVNVETVVVGNAQLDEKLAALVAAVNEATVNAARHSGDETVAVYVEVGDKAVSAYVRDHGRGFDSSRLPPDRGGLAESVIGRIERHGGSVDIKTAPQHGAEIFMKLPR